MLKFLGNKRLYCGRVRNKGLDLSVLKNIGSQVGDFERDDIQMDYIVDILLAVLSVIIVVLSAKKGFAKSVLNICANVAAYAVAYFLSKPIAVYIFDNFISGSITRSLVDDLNQIGAEEGLAQVTEAVASLPDWVGSLCGKIGLDISSLTQSAVEANVSAQSIAQSITESIVRPAALLLLGAVSALILFALSLFILRFVVKALDKLFKIPVVGTVNSALGAALGFVKAAVFLLVTSTVLYLAQGLISGSFAQAIEASRVLELIDSVNPIIKEFI